MRDVSPAPPKPLLPILPCKNFKDIDDLFEYRIEKDRLSVPLKNNGV
jgi:hypothetical protein